MIMIMQYKVYTKTKGTILPNPNSNNLGLLHKNINL